MRSLPVLDSPAPNRRLPSWLKRQLPRGNENFFTHHLLRELRLETVCENARCPNRPECYARRTATFMILGNLCTRPCGFCAVARGQPQSVEDDEPERVAEAAYQLGLKHVVITSVTRDDLPDGGADHFYRCIRAVRARTRAAVEVLTPDFLGAATAIDRVLEAHPEVYNHNVETVPRLYQKVRGRADYQRSLDLLGYVKRRAPEITTKSGLMLGLGETTEELLDALADLRAGTVSSANIETRPGCAVSSPGGIRPIGRTGPGTRLPPGRQRAFCAFQLPRRRDGEQPSEQGSDLLGAGCKRRTIRGGLTRRG